MALVFVSGPYRGPGNWAIEQNIRRAEALALEAWALGAAVICPHKNTAHFDGALPDGVWLAGDLEMVRRCDAVVCTSDWARSTGARGEVELARSLGIPVFESITELASWLESRR
jgi:hypothetical protein